VNSSQLVVMFLLYTECVLLLVLHAVVTCYASYDGSQRHSSHEY